MRVSVLGAGAFGTALAVVLAGAGREVTLWTRDAAQCRAMRAAGRNDRYLPDVPFPPGLSASDALDEAAAAPILLLAVPMQSLGALLGSLPETAGKDLVSCAKGIDLATGLGSTGLIAAHAPGATAAVLSGPGFAADIARGLPTALTLGCRDEGRALALQEALSAPALRLYRTDDTRGVELGGALKNVVAIGAGVVAGAGLGESARAALVTRGFAEMARLARAAGARAETLAGLSGLGDLILTSTSHQSRNFRFGLALGAGETPVANVTVEGRATARAALALAARLGIDLPVTATVAALIDRRLTLGEAVAALLSRPLTREWT